MRRRAMPIDQNADSVSLAIDAKNTTANTVEINANTSTTGTMLLASDGDADKPEGFSIYQVTLPTHRLEILVIFLIKIRCGWAIN